MSEDHERRVVRTTCNRDCPDACSVLVTLEGDQMVGLRGDPAHPVTRGFLCYRTRRQPAWLQRSADRIVKPRARRSWFEAFLRGERPARRPPPRAEDPWVELDWERALDFAAMHLERIVNESGGAAILNYRSGGSLGMLKVLTDAFFEALGPVAIKRGDICSGAGEAAQEADFGISDASDLSDLENARAIVLWGKRPHVSNVHLLPWLRRARERGARLVAIDPVHHEAASLVDRFVQPRPGGDLALALALARALFERGLVEPGIERWCEGVEGFRRLVFERPLEGWLRAADVSNEALEEILAALCPGPCTILIGWGLQRRRAGGVTVRAIDAVAALSSNIGRAGAGASFYMQRRRAFDTGFVRGLEVAPRTVLEPRLGAEVLEARDPPYRALWVSCANPVAMLPESYTVRRALESRELTVVVDSHRTDTTEAATLVLPCATLWEQEDVVGAYGHHHLGSVRKVIEPPPGVLTDLEIVQALAERLGLLHVVEGSARAWKQRLLGGIDLEAVETGYVRAPGAPQVAFEGRVFPRPGGRMRLLDALGEAGRWAIAGPPASPYDLWLMSHSVRASQASQWSAPRAGNAGVATLHPETARLRGLEEGGLALLESAVSSMRVRIRFDAAQRRDVVLVPKGGWLMEGACVNALVEAAATDLGGGAAYQDTRVRLSPIAGGEDEERGDG